jgi:hypothetical protein
MSLRCAWQELTSSSVFNDFGPNFACVDPTGENPLSGMVVHVENAEEALVTCLDETRHGLEDGDFVTFSEVKGMEELNGCEPRKVSVKGQCSVQHEVVAYFQVPTLSRSVTRPRWALTRLAVYSRKLRCPRWFNS